MDHHGTVYTLPIVGPNLLQLLGKTPTTYQANLLHIQRKFIIGTADECPKRDLQITKAAMLR